MQQVGPNGEIKSKDAKSFQCIRVISFRCKGSGCKATLILNIHISWVRSTSQPSCFGSKAVGKCRHEPGRLVHSQGLQKQEVPNDCV
jgi:hypothetical protein